jgi:thymidylate synthase (FAD)
MEATYLGHYGDDLVVANAARVSFGKRKEVFDEKDARLIRFLARENHIIPFAHPQVSFHFKAPIFVARQLAKHQIGFAWSEVSRRYVKNDPELYIPATLRKGSSDIKQGSLDEEVEDHYGQKHAYAVAAAAALNAYRKALEAGVCPEQARALLPQAAYTEWHWTGSLLGWSRVWNLRVKPDAQRETRQVVEQIGPTMSLLFPICWEALTNAAAD